MRLVVRATGIGFDLVMNNIWNMKNKGKLWKDVKDLYGEDE